MKLTPAHIQHGTNGGYAYHGCRCELCKAARTKYLREYRAMIRKRETRRLTKANCGGVK